MLEHHYVLYLLCKAKGIVLAQRNQQYTHLTLILD